MSAAPPKVDVYELCGYLVGEEELAALQFGEIMSLRLQWPGDVEARTHREKMVSGTLDLAIDAALAALGAVASRGGDGKHWFTFRTLDPAVAQMWAQIARMQFRLAREFVNTEDLADVEIETPYGVGLARLSDLKGLLGYEVADEPDNVEEFGWWEMWGVNTFEEFKVRYCS